MRRNTLVIVAALGVLGACNKTEQRAGDPAPAPSETPTPTATAEKKGLLERGDEAPTVEAVAHDGSQVKLADYRGKPVVVYFYPKDDTPGCTVQAQGFRDEWTDLAKSGAVVLGVSTDDNESHKAFAAKYELPFLLLPDTDQKIATAFGVPIVNGHAKRVTFVIDKQGKVARVFPEVTPKGHADEVLAAVAALES
jgi:thioredoxin-dependent peroxiredoxin